MAISISDSFPAVFVEHEPYNKIFFTDNRGSRKLSISRQAKLLSINRTSLYYKPVQVSDEEYGIKRVIDEIYTAHPEYGYRRMTVVLKGDCHIHINRKRARRYMREMGIHGFCPGPNLSKRLRGKYVYPYLLRGLNIDRPNQVWSVDITYYNAPIG